MHCCPLLTSCLLPRLPAESRTRAAGRGSRSSSVRFGPAPRAPLPLPGSSGGAVKSSRRRRGSLAPLASTGARVPVRTRRSRGSCSGTRSSAVRRVLDSVSAGNGPSAAQLAVLLPQVPSRLRGALFGLRARGPPAVSRAPPGGRRLCLQLQPLCAASLPPGPATELRHEGDERLAGPGAAAGGVRHPDAAPGLPPVPAHPLGPLQGSGGASRRRRLPHLPARALHRLRLRAQHQPAGRGGALQQADADHHPIHQHGRACDVVAGRGAHLRPLSPAALHSGPLGLQPLLLPVLRHAGGQEHLHGVCARAGGTDGPDERLQELLLQSGPGLPLLHGVPRAVLPGGAGGRAAAARGHRAPVGPAEAPLRLLQVGVKLPNCFRRSRVWAEPCVLSCAVAKLGGAVEGWLRLAEDLFGAYLWGRCDLVFLPPSFPVVAMENPCLTFMAASILESSDFLLVDVVHEIAHSWFGNAVTNASWEQMWLSEGVATYAQRRITSCAYGEAFTCLETVLRLDALQRQLRLLGDNSPASRLQAQLQSGVNPSTLINLFTYEKGFCLVSYLSQLCGDVRRFDRFLKDYISQFKFQSVVAQDLIDYFLSCFPHLQNQGLQFQRWLNGCGAPPFQPDVSAGSTLTGPVQELCDLWRCSTSVDLQAVSRFDLSAWNSLQVALFLDRMLDHAPYSSEVMTSLSGCYSSLFHGLSAEVLIRWLQLVVRSCFWPELPRVRAFLQKHTSRMYTVPLYEDLLAGSMRTVAGEIFQQTKHRLHPNLRRALQQILPPPPDT